MLIHTSGRVYAHQDMKSLVEKQLNAWKKLRTDEMSRLFEECWESEKSRGTIDGDEQLPKFIEIESIVSKVLDELKLIVDNSRSDDRLVYDFENEEESVHILCGQVVTTIRSYKWVDGLVTGLDMKICKGFGCKTISFQCFET
jgi:Z1 domain